MNSRKGIIFIPILVLVFLMLMIFFHEIGHYIIAKYFFNLNFHVYLWPGYEILPNFGEKFPGDWPDSSLGLMIEDSAPIIISSDLNLIPRNDIVLRNRSFIGLMGCGLTYILSILSLLVLSFYKPKKGMIIFLVMIALLHIDMFTYAIFPTFFNLKHLLIIGGSEPEPINALVQLGFSKFTAISAVIVLSVINFIWLYCILVKFKQSPNNALNSPTTLAGTPPSASPVS